MGTPYWYGDPHIGMGRDMSIFQIGESPYQYGAHSNLGTNISVEALDATLLLTVGMGVSQCLEERGRTVPMEIDCTNEGSNGINSRRCVRSGQAKERV